MCWFRSGFSLHVSNGLFFLFIIGHITFCSFLWKPQFHFSWIVTIFKPARILIRLNYVQSVNIFDQKILLQVAQHPSPSILELARDNSELKVESTFVDSFHSPDFCIEHANTNFMASDGKFWPFFFLNLNFILTGHTILCDFDLMTFHSGLKCFFFDRLPVV